MISELQMTTGHRRAPKGHAAGRGVVMQTGIFVLALLVASGAFARKPVTRLRGSWTATAGPGQVFTGTWTAETTERKPNEARGYWTLLSAGGDIRAEGRWSARKTGHRWHGTWTARSGDGPPFSGSWSADINGSSAEETFAAMLKSTATKIVTGSWEYGAYAGNWWLRGPSHSRN
jgi:hypothetical protein